MAFKRTSPAAVLKAIKAKQQESRNAAVMELKDLKKDLADLERLLKAKKPLDDFPIMDVVQGALELQRLMALEMESEQFHTDMQSFIQDEMTRENLTDMGATLLKKPKGWHWVSPKGEMHLLCEEDEPETALNALREIKSPKKKAAQKKAAAKKADKPTE